MTQYSPLSSLARPAIALVIAAYPIFHAAPARSLQFNFGFAEDTPPEVIQGFEDAGNLWSSFLSDDITVDVAVQYEPFNQTSLGRFTPERVNVEYRDVLGALQNDIGSVNDTISFNALPRSSELGDTLDSTLNFGLLINGTADNPNGSGSLVPYLDNDGDCNNHSIRITTANAKALGLPTTGTGTCSSGVSSPSNDGIIAINSNFDWDFDISDGFDPLTYDFVGVAAQGIGATLGNISGIDVLDFNSPLVVDDESLFFEDSMFPFVSLPDLHRFSPESAELGVIDWTTGRTDETGAEVSKYFSIDGGQTPIANFSTGIRRGDGNRASSWQADEIGGG
ncbi:MAG: NF038122 family metalloprotease, partial [Cyanobacteria bacterium P01_E01_bin.6]